MRKTHGTEVDFKSWFMKSWAPHWSEAYEPRGGTGMGLPDVQVLINEVLLPLELKIGMEHDAILFPRDVRPAQIEWHRRFAAAGGNSAMLVGLPVDNKRRYRVRIVNGTNLNTWAKGYDWTSAPELHYPITSSLAGWFLYGVGSCHGW